MGFKFGVCATTFSNRALVLSFAGTSLSVVGASLLQLTCGTPASCFLLFGVFLPLLLLLPLGGLSPLPASPFGLTVMLFRGSVELSYWCLPLWLYFATAQVSDLMVLFSLPSLASLNYHLPV